MRKTENLQFLGGMIALGLTASLYHTITQKGNDRLASKLLIVLTQKLDPSSKGLAAENAFDIRYKDRVLRTISGNIAVLKKSRAIQLAKQLHSGFKPWYQNDKEEVIYNVLRGFKDKLQVSQMAKAYQNEYKINLIEQLQEHFNATEVAKALTIVDKLPPYRTL